jgi:hypothetical protein
LTIAVGGIATGIGAIWAALVAKRQAQLTERSLAEQVQSLREQNESTRLNLEVDLLTRWADRFQSPHFLSRRRAAAKHVIDTFLVDDEMVEVGSFNLAAHDVANFFEGVGYLHRLGALQTETVWHTFGAMARAYWTVYEPTIQRMREEYENPALYEDFQRLNRLVADLDSERGIEPLTQESLRQLMEDEAVLGEEPRPTTE